MRMLRMMTAVIMAAAIMVPVIKVSATEGGYGRHSSSNGTSTTASGETIYDKAVAASGGTDTTANVESMVDKTVIPEATYTPNSEDYNFEDMPTPEQGIELPQDVELEPVPKNNEGQIDMSQILDSANVQNTENNIEPELRETVVIPENEIAVDLESKIAGIYQANSVGGCAVITESEIISQNYGFVSGEESYAKFLDLDESRYLVSSRMLDLAADSQGAEVCARLNIELGKMTGEKYSLLPSDGAEIQVALGIPLSFVEEGKTYAVVCVRKDGTVSILKDQDENQGTVTFNTAGGAGVYAIIRY